MKNSLYFIFLVVIMFNCPVQGRPLKDSLPLKVAILPNGIKLHYVSKGSGEPLIFIHGSISDYTYWEDQVNYFSKFYRVIAYSRRYNYPNHNPAVKGYSAEVDAEDLAAFIKTLHLGKVNIVGHSYGALTALFFAIHHKDMLKRLVLAEPPAVPLLDHLSGPENNNGKEIKKDIDKRMVAPMQKDFKEGKSEDGVEAFINYVHNDTTSWQRMSAASHQETMRDVAEWNIMMPSGTLFPFIKKTDIAQIRVPVLILSGDKSYHFLNLIDAELHKVIPDNHQYILHGAGHQMWFDKTDECRRLTLYFLKKKQ